MTMMMVHLAKSFDKININEALSLIVSTKIISNSQSELGRKLCV